MEKLTDVNNPIITLDDSLEAIEINQGNYTLDLGKNEVRRVIEGKFLHKNYLEYLHLAWANHKGIIMSPDIFWHIVSCETATHIKENASAYAGLFTTTPDKKQDIIVETTDSQLIPLDRIEDQLRMRVPTNIDLFIPSFSTTNKNSYFAFVAAFADAMQVYYNYSMYMCGIPNVQLLGTYEDWHKIETNVSAIKNLLDKKTNKYFDGVLDILTSIIENKDRKFWKNIFSLERCGSGSQVEVAGWISDLFMKKGRPGYISNYSALVSKVPYTFLDTKQKFELCHGLFGSDERDNFLVPEFGYTINEIKS